MTAAVTRPRTDPVVGWRYWQLTPALRSGTQPALRSGTQPAVRLRSVTQRRCEWPPGGVMRAGCLGAGHRAPDARCDCGLYGARDLETLREHGLCLAPEALVVGRVALWGLVLPDVSGWRGEYAEPAAISVVQETVLDEELAGVLASLQAYGVPVDTMALTDAVAGVTATTLAFQAMAAKASRTRA
jgi:hypothetical protein